MEAIDQRHFGQTYVFVRHAQHPLIGPWDLYKQRSSGEMVYVKDIKFYSEIDRDEYLPRINSCTILASKKDNGFLKCLGVVSKNGSSEGGYSFSILVLFEYFETSFDKVMLKHINESKTFTIKDILKIANRLASSLEVLERNNMVHGDVRSGNIAVMPNGSLNLVWAPFIKSTLELMSEASSQGITKVMNPSPEVVEAFNHLNFEKRNLSGYKNMGQDVSYSKNDIYSLGIFILKLSNLYSTEPFYLHGTTIKVNTKKIEASILKLYSLNKRLGVCLNKMLVYDPYGRASFEEILEVLSSKEELIDRGLSIGDVNSATGRKPILVERSDNRAIFETDPLGAGDFTLTQSMNDHGEGPDDFLHIENHPGQFNMSKQRTHFDNDPPQSEYRGFGSPRDQNYQQGIFNGSLSGTPMKSTQQLNRDQQRPLPIFGASERSAAPYGQPSLLPVSLFEQRGLGDLKTSLITKLESAIFFDESGRLRTGIKIKESIGSKYVGEMFCGRRSGLGIQYYCNGDVCVGSWATGDMDGEGVYFMADGSVYVGNLRANKRDGFGKLHHANGDVYEGDWYANKKNGQGVYFYYAKDTLYEGNWVLNYKEGWGSYYSRSGEWVEGEWKGNRLVMQKNHGYEEAFPQVSNILDFYTNRNGWNEIVEKLQAILNEKGNDINLSMHESQFNSQNEENSVRQGGHDSQTYSNYKENLNIQGNHDPRRPNFTRNLK